MMIELEDLRDVIFSNDDEYFVSLITLTAQRSKDPCTQVAACVVDPDNNLVGLGYNGMPVGCHDDRTPWGKHTTDPLENKHLYVCHAELNAITNSNRMLDDCTIYVTLFPCNECAKLIIQNGITKVVYLSDKHAHKPQTKAAKIMFQRAGVEYVQFISKKQFFIQLPNGDESNGEVQTIQNDVDIENLNVGLEKVTLQS